MPDLISPAEAAKILERSPREVYRLAKIGALPTAEITSSGRRRYDRAAVEAYFQEHGPPGPQGNRTKGAERKYNASRDADGHRSNIKTLVGEIERSGDFSADLVRVLEVRALAEAMHEGSSPQQYGAALKALSTARENAESAGTLVPRMALVNVIQTALTSLGEKMGQTLRERVERQADVGPLEVDWICQEVRELAEAVEEDLMQAYEPFHGEVG